MKREKGRDGKGIFLICALFATTLISIFMIGAAKNLHESLFVVKKFLGERKAYWAAQAGQAYAIWRMHGDKSWPFSGTLKDNDFGTYKVSESRIGDVVKIHGKSGEGDSEFFIVFSNSKTPKGDYSTIVPEGFEDDDDLRYFSYNTLSSSGDSGNYVSEIIETAEKPFSRKTVISRPGVYIAADGRSGAYRSALEKMVIIESSEQYTGGIYSGGDIEVNLKGENAIMSIVQASTGKPDVFCKGAFSVGRTSLNQASKKTKFPVQLADGTVYYRSDVKIDDKVTNKVYSSMKSSDRNSFKRKYGLNIDKYSASNEFPVADWNSITKKAKKNFKLEIETGTYAAIYNNESEKYDLYYIEHYSRSEDAVDSIAEKLNEMMPDGETGNSTETYLKKAFGQNSRRITDSKALSIETVESGGAKAPLIHVKDDVAVKGDIEGLAFISIDRDGPRKATVEDTEPPADEDPSPGTGQTDDPGGSYGRRSNGYVASAQSLTLKFDSNEKEERLYQKKDNDEIEEISKFTKDPASIYCDGPITVKGRLKGEGQLFGGSSVTFDTGSDLNVISEESEKKYGSSNQIAIYAKGSVRMGYIGMKSNMEMLYEKLKNCMSEKSGNSTYDLERQVLNSKIQLTETDMSNLDPSAKVKRNCTLEELMEKGYGYTERERSSMVRKSIESNMSTSRSRNNRTGMFVYTYRLPKEDKIEVPEQSPSSFKGIIYTCGGFYANMEDYPLTLNGVIVSYGGDPSLTLPGTGDGIDNSSLLGLEPGSIKIDNCSNFTIIYDSTDLNAFITGHKENIIKNFVTVYFNVI